MGYYKYIKKTRLSKEFKGIYKKRLIEWRKEKVVTKIKRPTKPDKAHSLGYKSKKGFVVIRTRIKRGGRKRPKVHGGRKPSKSGRVKYTPKLSLQVMAEQRVARKFPNLEVLNSYWAGEDGKSRWFEIILVDPKHPSVINDKDTNWICSSKHRRRVFRGLTGAGKKSRGLLHKGPKAAKIRPSVRSHSRKGK